MAVRAINIEKYVDEILDQSVDFEDVLADGESVSSGAVKIKDSTDTDVTSTLAPAGGSSSGTSVEYRLAAAGTAGMTYSVYALATLNTGEVLGQRFRMTLSKP